MSPGSLAHAVVSLAWLVAGGYGVAVLDRWIVSAGPPSVRALVQPLASAARLLRAPGRLPQRPDDALYLSAPLLASATVTLAAWVVPLGPLPAGDSPVGLFYFVVLLGPFAVVLANAGWSTNGKYGLVASMRAASHLVAYEVVLGFAILGPAMAAESLSMVRIVEAQKNLWFVVWQPLGLVLYLVCVLFAVYRRPFDTPFTSELAGGVLGEYGGARLLLLRAAVSALLFVAAAAGAAIYLGGWHGPPGVGHLLPGPAWMMAKTFALVVLILWAGRRSPRFGHDQMLRFSWKVVLPVAFVNLAATGILILVLDP